MIPDIEDIGEERCVSWVRDDDQCQKDEEQYALMRREYFEELLIGAEPWAIEQIFEEAEKTRLELEKLRTKDPK